MHLRVAQNYLGYAVVGFMWLCFFLGIALLSPDLSEPLSQYGYYPRTQFIFAFGCVVFGVLYYLFSRKLNTYWQHASLTSLVGSVFFALTGLIPYEPYAKSFVFDAHNASVTLAVLFYALPMLFISYTPSHKKIAQVSRYLFVALFILVAISFIVRVYDLGIFYFQLLAIVPFHIWIIATNYLMLTHAEPISTTEDTSLL